MNDDKELTELAAKAAGISGRWNERSDWFELDEATMPFGQLFAPLRNDGDALRLAVKLGLGNRVLCLSIGGEKSACEFNYVAHGSDAYAATRRAIVLAAAEIGRKMP